ncbi:hypothetical protein [Sporosarcina sp. YIM B06819]|uniref:hypothetical protein n=1 Tax=Sporosarcina sp. YIM B06819 TaxID=3081769 RepID=UPI00298BFEAA|nr:hypothetical protein [Sporosarcina sp. YIM B06819]
MVLSKLDSGEKSLLSFSILQIDKELHLASMVATLGISQTLLRLVHGMIIMLAKAP